MLLPLAALLSLPAPTSAQVLESDSLALVALYDSTDGANWTTTWDLNTPVDAWYGVTVTNGRVDTVDLRQNNLIGSIPAELGNLSNLTYLHLGFNQISGSIPIELGDLASLTTLFLGDNQLTGSIPTELGNLASLWGLFLHSNQLTGSIPTELGNLANLTYLDLPLNQLSGSAPAELGNLANLTYLDLRSNQLSGSIPAELGNLASLTVLYLQFNQLTGSIPAELGNLANLTVLVLGSNQLSGSIPAELGNLANLTALNLCTNQLNGSVPAELENLTNIADLWLYSNQLTGLPDLSTLTALSTLLVENNRLTFEDLEPNMGVASNSFTYAPQDSVGTGQDTVLVYGASLVLSVEVGGTVNQYQWTKDGVDVPGATDDTLSITSVVFADSGSYVLRVTNTIVPDLTLYSRPVKLSIATSLETDSLALVALYDSTDGANWTNNTNWLNPDSAVSTWYGVTVSDGRVTELSLNSNQLTGSIPIELGSLANLTVLSLWSNQLSGPIPAKLGNLANLTYLHLGYNQLTGSIPAELGDLTNLTRLGLHNNQISGAIPTELGNLANLQFLALANNPLTGSIPAELGNLVNLTGLYFYSNQLSGSIPTELGNLANLTSLDLSGNQLTGAIPAELGNLTNLTRLDLAFNQLTGLPDLSTLTALDYLQVENNRLTFEDLEPNMDVASSSFTYAPQDSVGNDSTIVWGLNGHLTLSIPVGGTANVYQWMKDSVDILGATDDTLIIEAVTYDDSGSYALNVTNTIVPDLTLYSRSRRLKVVANQEPVLTAIPDTTIQEDDTLRIVLHGSDIYDDPLTYASSSDTGAVATTVADSLMTIIPEPEWNGVTSIFASVSDGQFTVRDTFAVTVTPVNDPPGPFALLSPPADTLMYRFGDAIWDTVTFSWARSRDVEGDVVLYNFTEYSQHPLFWSDPTSDTTIYLIPGIAFLAKSSAFTDTVTWNVTAHDGTDSTLASNGPRTLLMVFDYPSAIDDERTLPAEFALRQNYPNPFNPATTIQFDLPVATEVHLAGYDLLGREVALLARDRREAGYHQVIWNGKTATGREVPSGIYIARLVTPEYRKSIKMLLLK